MGEVVTPEQCKKQVAEDLGEDVLREMARIVGRAYPSAYTRTLDQYGRQTGRDLYPHVRRADIEKQFSELPARFPHLQAFPTENKRLSSRYVRLVSNDTVITQSKTEAPGELARPAEFRLTCARVPETAVLPGFSDFIRQVPVQQMESTAVYGLVAHGPSEDDPSRMAYVEVLVPDRAGKNVVCQIDLWPYWRSGGDYGRVVFPVAPIAPASPVLKPGITEKAEGQ
jgi:hypothetical protein